MSGLTFEVVAPEGRLMPAGEVRDQPVERVSLPGWASHDSPCLELDSRPVLGAVAHAGAELFVIPKSRLGCICEHLVTPTGVAPERTGDAVAPVACDVSRLDHTVGQMIAETWEAGVFWFIGMESAPPPSEMPRSAGVPQLDTLTLVRSAIARGGSRKLMLTDKTRIQEITIG